jgi:hypothetical protein
MVRLKKISSGYGLHDDMTSTFMWTDRGKWRNTFILPITMQLRDTHDI